MKKLLKTTCVKIAALSLVLTMIFSYMPTAFAMKENDEIQPQGYWTDEGNYDVQWYTNGPNAQEFTISTPAELAGLAVIVNALDNNIAKKTFEGKTINLIQNLNMHDHCWTPIGYTQEVWNGEENELPQNYFAGNFNGNNHTISKLQTIDKSKNNQGLFGIVITGSIKKLGIIDNNIIGKSDIGGVAGSVRNNSTITSCYNKGNINGEIGIGGVVGFLEEECTIQDCYNNGNVNKKEDQNSGFTDDEVSRIGGIVGNLGHSNTIKLCCNMGEINGLTEIGGIVGSLSDECTISSCSNTGNVTGKVNNIDEITYLDEIGGISGSIHGNFTMTSCSNTGNVTGTFNSIKNLEERLLSGIGGIVGSNSFQNPCNNCYYCNDKGKLPENANQIGEAMPLNEMQPQEFLKKFAGCKIIINNKIKCDAFLRFE